MASRLLACFLLLLIAAVSVVPSVSSDSSSDDDKVQTIASIELTLTENVESAEPIKANAYVVAGEDFAVGAFRFAEDHSFFHVQTVIDVAKKVCIEQAHHYIRSPTTTSRLTPPVSHLKNLLAAAIESARELRCS